MRYLFTTFLLIFCSIINVILFFTQRSGWEIGTILFIDIGLCLGLYAIKLHYWSQEYLEDNRKIKIAALFVIWLGMLFAYMGIHVGVSGEYHLDGSRIRAALYRDLMNTAGDVFGPWAVACVWLILGTVCIYYGWHGYKRA